MAKTKMEPRGRAFELDHQGRLLTCAQAGEALGLKEATIRVWIARRRLAFVKLGRAVRVPSEAIDEMIAANIVPARENKCFRAR